MTRFVVDASVIAKWSFDEIHSEAASRLLTGPRELWVPDLVWSETGNIVWKKWRRNEITEEDGRTVLQSFKDLPLLIYPSRLLVDSAWEIAPRLGRSFYDSIYLALTVHRDCPMVTADLRLYNALLAASSSIPLVWVADIS